MVLIKGVKLPNKIRQGIVFDIDGVLLHGKKALPRAKSAMVKAVHHKVPWVVCTNGGGVSEERKAKQLSELLELEVSPQQKICLAHSPMKALATRELQDKPVLIIGAGDSVAVARSYGFRRAFSSEDLIIQFPDQHWAKPKRPSTCNGDLAVLPGEHVVAAMLFYDPFDWTIDSQILLDVLRGGYPPGTAPPGTQVPLVVSNMDFLYSSSYPAPRLGSGAFVHSLAYLYKKLYGGELKYSAFGKPSQETLTFVESQFLEISGTVPDTIYMVGDNPESDVAIAKLSPKWRSVLVSTGVAQHNEHDICRADAFVDDVEAAIDAILVGDV